MLNDARSLWTSASSVVQNIASALTEDPNEKEEYYNEIQQELDIYKRMLEEAQMSLVEMSKASRLAIAEKEAELAVYKFGNIIMDTSKLDYARSLAEKVVLADNVKELEQLVVHYQHNESKVNIKNELYDELKTQLVNAKTEFNHTLKELSSQDKTRLDTIDNLVAEYSKLASEYESHTIEWNIRHNEILRENEILVMKMAVLESTVSDLATSNASTSNAKGLNQGETSDIQLKELRSKIINLQYDLKEKSEIITQLKHTIATSASSSSSNANDSTIGSNVRGSGNNDHTKYEEELSAMKQSITSLNAERVLLMEREEHLIVKYNTLMDEVKRKESLESSPSSAAFRSTLQAEIAKVRGELTDKTNEYAQLEVKYSTLVSKQGVIEDRHAKAIKESEEAIDVLRLKVEEFTSKLIEAEEAMLVLSNSIKEEQTTSVLLREEVVARDARIVALSEECSALQSRALSGVSDEEELQRLRDAVTVSKAEVVAAQVAATEREEALRVEVCALEDARRAMQEQRERALESEEKLRAELTSRADSSREALAAEAMLREEQLASLRLEMQSSAASAVEVLAKELKQEHDKEVAELATLHGAALASKVEEQRSADKAEYEALLEKMLAEKSAEKERAVERAVEKTVEDVSALFQLRIDEDKVASEAAMAEEKRQFDAVVATLESAVAAAERHAAEARASVEEAVASAVAEAEVSKEREMTAALARLKDELQGMVDRAVAEKDEYFALYSKEREQRKSIHNKLLELQGNIRVVCRARPVLEVERKQGSANEVDITDFQSDDVLLIQRDAQTRTRFEFDRVFAQNSSQEEVFSSVQPLCVSVLDGYNICIFAYGQTGSGKTFTMEGYGDAKGVAPRAVNELFRIVNEMRESGHYEYTIKFSMLEIYNETIRDLLDSSTIGKDKDKLDIRQTAEGVNIVQGLIEEDVDDANRVGELMRVGQSNRAVGSHDMNEHSSRSHSILTLTCRGRNLIDESTTFGKLHLIDLAGSERLSKTDATGDRLKEAQNINRSLSALGDVINALGNKKATHIPYRNSKLTFLLQDSLGGNSKVLMFVNISPAAYNLGETLCSLNFASRCRSVELGQAKKQSNDDSSASARRRVDGIPSGAGTPSSTSVSPTLSTAALVTPVKSTRTSIGGSVNALGLPKSSFK